MSRKSKALFLLVVIQFVALVIATINSTAQVEDDYCYPLTGGLVVERVPVKPTFDSSYHLTRVSPGDHFRVYRSRRFKGACWIEIDEGWIPSAAVEPALPPTSTPLPTPTPLPTSTPLPACFSESRAYVSGDMNIRKSHEIGSGVMARAKRGDVFEVSASRRGGPYCWLNVGTGWMAVTSYVHGSMPSSLLPRIEGSSSFRRQIRNGFEYLWDNAPDWFWYVADNVSVVIRATNNRSRSTAEPRIRRVAIHPEHLSPVIELASVLVHEACHMVQYKRGDRIPWYDYDGEIRQEKECFRVQRRMVQEIDSDHSYIILLTAMLKQSHTDWMRYVLGH